MTKQNKTTTVRSISLPVAAHLLTQRDGGKTLLKHYLTLQDGTLRDAVARMDQSGA